MAVPRRAFAQQTRGVLRSMKAMSGFALKATDGLIGRVEEFYFDDITRIVRYLVADTGRWLTGRLVLIPPAALLRPDWDNKVLPVDLSREQIEKSHGIDKDKPVSRQHEIEIYRHYGWTPYWTSTTPGAVPIAVYSEESGETGLGDVHLRSSKEVVGYAIQAVDGRIGHVEDFLADDRSWTIRYLVVDTRDWLPGKKALLSVSWIKNIDWAAERVSVDLSRETIRNGPEYLTAADVTPEYEERLFAYYNRPAYWI